MVELRSEINRLEIIEKTHLGEIHSLDDKLEQLKDVEKQLNEALGRQVDNEKAREEL